MEKQLYINGQWVAAKQHMSIQSPYSGKEIASIAAASKEQVNEAIEAAQQAKEAMRNLTSQERASILFSIADQFAERREEAARIISSESGKPLKFALAEIDRTIETYRFAGEEGKRLVGEMIPMDAAKTGKSRFGYTVPEPIGVIGAITPFNFPQNLVAHKVGPAIAAGNPIVLKPASQTSLSALFLAELIDKTNLPKGGFHVVTGSGGIVGDAITGHPLVKMITFTGSPSVGIGIRNKAGLKRVSLELGSNSGLIIDEGMNLGKIADKCVVGAFSNQGQVCISLQRIYVMESQYDEFVALFTEKAKALRSGPPEDMETDISAMIHPKEAQRAKEWIDEAVSNGAKLLSGGEIKDNILEPTVLGEVDSSLRISCEEIFAPVVLVNKIVSIEEGVSYINDSQFGLQAGIFTKDIEKATYASKQLEAGGVMINDIPTYRVDQMPYGGVKNSGLGKEGLKYAIHEMTEFKLVVWNQEGGY